jgi:outer membrane protein OmpA-like peptidoglycan-associated protein
MKPMALKTFTFLVCFFLFLNNCLSQGVNKIMADKYYNQLSFVQAADFYKELVKTKNPTEENIRKLAMCYYNITDYKNAEVYFKMLSKTYPDKLTEQDLLYYLQVQKYNENYLETDALLSKIGEKNKNNLVLKYHLDKPDYNKKLRTDSLNYNIKAISGINTEFSEFSPTFKTSKKAMTFASNRKNSSVSNKTFAWDDTYFMDIWEGSKKDSLNFDLAKAIVKDVSTSFHDGPLVYSKDEKTIFLTRNNVLSKKKGKNIVKLVNLKLLIIKYDSINKRWGKPEEFEFNSNEYSIGHPAISDDGKYLYFASDMPGGYGLTDLYVSEFVNNKWQKPVNLGQAINTEGREMFPFIHEDGTLFFATDGRAGLGGLDIYFSPINLDQFFEPQNLGYPLNTNMDDFGFYLNSDLLTGYVSSNRKGGLGKDDIYYFTSKKPIIGSSLSGLIVSNASKEKIPNAQVYLYSSEKKLLDSLTTKSDGKYSFVLNDPTVNYTIKVIERDKYYDKTVELTGLSAGDNIRDVELNSKYLLVGHVYDAETKAPIEGVVISLTNKATKQKLSFTTDAAGTFTDVIRQRQAGDKINFTVRFEKKGYITTIQDYGIILDTFSVINLDEQLNVNMQKMVIGNDIAKAIKINPIYFDLGKADIKSIAAIELDKIVNIMNENPTMVIELGSHTDCRSSKIYNSKLSDKRAKASAIYIMTKGIASIRIKGKGYGETKLINKCECEGKKVVTCTEDEHQANRRTEFLIVNF